MESYGNWLASLYSHYAIDCHCFLAMAFSLPSWLENWMSHMWPRKNVSKLTILLPVTGSCQIDYTLENLIQKHSHLNSPFPSCCPIWTQKQADNAHIFCLTFKIGEWKLRRRYCRLWSFLFSGFLYLLKNTCRDEWHVTLYVGKHAWNLGSKYDHDIKRIKLWLYNLPVQLLHQ